jgi:hypothetical protein
MKRCKHCHLDKPETDYYANASTKDGLMAFCRTCFHAQSDAIQAEFLPDATKYCRDCKQDKARSEFYKNKASYDGLQTICKPCSVARAVARHKKHPDKKKEADKRYYDNHVEELREKNKDYHHAHKEESAIRNKRWREEHKEEQQEYRQQYYQEHREELLKKQTQYQKEHPEVSSACRSNRRARKRNAGGRATGQQIKDRIAFYDGKCWVCRGAYDCMDHFLPLAKGGTNWPANLRPICNSCNGMKGAKHPLDFIRGLEKRADKWCPRRPKSL